MRIVVVFEGEPLGNCIAVGPFASDKEADRFVDELEKIICDTDRWHLGLNVVSVVLGAPTTPQAALKKILTKH